MPDETQISKTTRTLDFSFLIDIYHALIDIFIQAVDSLFVTAIQDVDTYFANVILKVTRLYIQTEPDDIVLAFFAYIQNLVLERMVELITMVNITIQGVLKALMPSQILTAARSLTETAQGGSLSISLNESMKGFTDQVLVVLGELSALWTSNVVDYVKNEVYGIIDTVVLF